jgi:hypothetical protein
VNDPHLSIQFRNEWARLLEDTQSTSFHLLNIFIVRDAFAAHFDFRCMVLGLGFDLRFYWNRRGSEMRIRAERVSKED